MRVFESMAEAIPEIRRDLSKGPLLSSNRVQQLETPGMIAQETQNYAYTILRDGIPHEPTELYQLLLDSDMPDPGKTWTAWLKGELAHRLYPMFSKDTHHDLHPTLGDLVEGSHYSYTYGERMIEAVNILARTLERDQFSRRAWFPIFHPMDAIRAGEYTRIPCSLGYQAMIREIPGVGNALHLTYISRSCDFDKFWASDIWFANQFQKALLHRLSGAGHGNAMYTSSTATYPDLLLGSTSHLILSLHRFTDDSEELF